MKYIWASKALGFQKGGAIFQIRSLDSGEVNLK